jgi:hypothetical protein
MVSPDNDQVCSTCGKNGSTEMVWRSCVDDRFNGEFEGEEEGQVAN